MLLRLLSLALLITTSTLAYTALTDATLHAIPSPAQDFEIKSGALLAPILIPRVPGSEGSRKVLDHFVSFFHTQLPEWRLEIQNSTSTTPATGSKEIPFRNLIATRDPPWSQPGDVSRLALVAHYDSKLTPTGFVGATDSALPCAVIMFAARSIDAALTKRWSTMEEEGVGTEGYGGVRDERGIQILLLDGEEAFVRWTDEDSLYGSRSLAEEWESTPYAAASTFHNPLDNIALFLLLDLLGAASPRIPSYFKTTHWAYRALGLLESRIRALGLFASSPNSPANVAKRQARQEKNGKSGPWKPRKEPKWLTDSGNVDTQMQGLIEDDHIPFMARGVEVLHIIPTPFPTVWHTMDDDGEHLDAQTSEDWGRLITAFAAEWMDLEGFMPVKGGKGEEKRGAEAGRGNDGVAGIVKKSKLEDKAEL